MKDPEPKIKGKLRTWAIKDPEPKIKDPEPKIKGQELKIKDQDLKLRTWA